MLIRNIVSNWAGVGINLAVAFLLSPFLVHSLGDNDYGLWVLVLSVTGYMGLLDTGLRVSIVKHTAECNARKDVEGLNRILYTGLSLYLALGVVVIALSLVVAVLFDALFAVQASHVPLGRVLVVIAGLNVALTLPLGVLGGLLAGLQRYDLLNKASIAVLLARTAAIVAAIYGGMGVIALGWIHVAAQVLSGAILLWLAYGQFPQLDLRPRRLDTATMRTLYSYSGYIVLNNIGMFLLFYSGEVLIGMFIGTAAVTSYAIARSLVQYLSTIVGSMTQVFHPYASDQHERGNAGAVRDVLLVGTKTSLIISLPVAAALVIVGPAFIGLWMGPGYGRSSGTVLAWLAVAQVAWLSQSTAGNILMGVGRHRLISMANLATGVAGIAAAAAFIPWFGAVGAAAGPALPIFLWAMLLPIATARTVKITLPAYFKSAYLGPIAAVIPFSLVLFAVSRLWPATNLLMFVFQVGGCLSVFFPSVCLLAFNRTERERWVARFRPSRRLADLIP